MWRHETKYRKPFTLLCAKGFSFYVNEPVGAGRVPARNNGTIRGNVGATLAVARNKTM